MSLHESEITSRLTRFLGRKQMPRRLEGKPMAEDDEVRALVAAVARNAPRSTDALAQWWPVFEARLGEVCGGMWPTEKEIRDAAKGMAQDRGNGVDGGGADHIEAEAIRRMAAWFEKFRNQMPGHGRPERTAALIRMGLMANEREARFRGFDLGEDQRRRAAEQRMGRDEWRHHVAVTARLRGISEAEAEAHIRATASDPVVLGGLPDKRDVPDWGVAAE